jgi:hypothetical protein
MGALNAAAWADQRSRVPQNSVRSEVAESFGSQHRQTLFVDSNPATASISSFQEPLAANNSLSPEKWPASSSQSPRDCSGLDALGCEQSACGSRREHGIEVNLRTAFLLRVEIGKGSSSTGMERRTWWQLPPSEKTEEGEV